VPIDDLNHEDGVNAWGSVRARAARALGGQVYGYADYWERTGGFTSRRELPHAEGVLIFNLGEPIGIIGGDGGAIRLRAGEAFVAGAHLRPALSGSDGTQAGIHVFLPLATLRRLLGVPMHQLMDRVVPLDALLGAAARELGARLCEAPDAGARIALLDETLARRLADAHALGRADLHALHLLRTRPDMGIAGIARAAGWSRKHLADRMEDTLGVGPRCFRRLLRFQNLLALIGQDTKTPSWAALALEAGYCDQPHLIREFREFSGLTPAAYLARALPAGGGLPEA
jgi:AraC-like DNA-binding protein